MARRGMVIFMSTAEFPSGGTSAAATLPMMKMKQRQVALGPLAFLLLASCFPDAPVEPPAGASGASAAGSGGGGTSGSGGSEQGGAAGDGGSGEGGGGSGEGGGGSGGGSGEGGQGGSAGQGGAGGTSGAAGAAGSSGQGGAGNGGAAGSAGQGAGNGGASGNGGCKLGDLTCLGGVPAQCDAAGSFVPKAPCSGETPLCDDGLCVACLEGQRRCDPQGLPQLCSPQQTWLNQTACVAGETCSNGICTSLVVRGGFSSSKRTESAELRVRGGFVQNKKTCGSDVCVYGGFRP